MTVNNILKQIQYKTEHIGTKNGDPGKGGGALTFLETALEFAEEVSIDPEMHQMVKEDSSATFCIINIF